MTTPPSPQPTSAEDWAKHIDYWQGSPHVRTFEVIKRIQLDAAKAALARAIELFSKEYSDALREGLDADAAREIAIESVIAFKDSLTINNT